MKAVLLTAFGAPEVLGYQEVSDPVPLPGEALVRVRACGVNHLDLDIRSGVSRLPIELPHILGRDLVGEVVALNGADWPPVGTRVAAPLQLSCMRSSCRFCSTGRDNLCPNRKHPGVTGPGSYRELATFPADSLLPVPLGLKDDDVVAGMLAYATAWHGLMTLLKVEPGESVLVTGAAGAIGVAGLQMAQLAGTRVFAAVGSDRKREVPISVGVPAEQVINYTTHDLAAEVRRLTQGGGVDAVMEIVGGSVFSASLDALAPDGRLCVTGAHGGEVVSLDLVEVFRRQVKIYGSSAYSYFEVRKGLELMVSGLLKPPPHETMSLSEAAEAHRRIDARQNRGKVVLLP
jgi:NADPH:quinone reductase-like Zn-dependent oxidoreductase